MSRSPIMRQITGAHAADITRLLQGLVAKKMLLQEGQGRWGRYRLSVILDSVHKPDHSVHKPDHSVHKPDHSVHNEELRELAAAARTQKRLLPEEMERIILALCDGRWLTRNQLAELLDRHPDGLRSRFLTSMVAHNRLCLRYPDKPNRTDQAYTASSLVKENPLTVTKPRAE